MDEKINAYLQSLESGDYQQLIRLFAEGAVIHSPLYGRRPAPEFYRNLLADSMDSRIRLLNIYHQPGGPAAFDCVDLFEWDEQQCTTQLKIIYDASQTRPALEQQHNQKP